MVAVVEINKIEDYEHRKEIQEIITLFEDVLETEVKQKDLEFISNRLNGILTITEDKVISWPGKEEWSEYDRHFLGRGDY